MTSKMESLNIIEIARVSPSDSSITEFALPLAFFDTYWIKFPPTERVIFYKLTDPTHEFFNSIILPELKRALAFALNHYVPLAGNITLYSNDSKPVILYKAPTDAVSLTVAESTSDMSRLSGNGIRKAVELHPLVSELTVSDRDRKASCLSLQVTFFDRQGFSIGVTSHHAVADGQTVTMFLKSWAYICKQLVHRHERNDVDNVVEEEEEEVIRYLPDELIPFYDRRTIKNPINDLDIILLNFWLGKDGLDPSKGNLKLLPFREVDRNLVRYTFVLTRKNIEKLKEIAFRNVKKGRLSTFVVVYSYVLVCMVKAKSGNENNDLCLIFPVDYRSRLDPPVPSNYFGSCVMGCTCTSKVGDFTRENGLVFAFNKISDMVSGISSEILEKAYENLKVIMSFDPKVSQVYSMAGSTRFGVYGVDFGWGKPVKVEILSIDRTGAIAMSDCRDENGGVEVGVSLNRHEMAIFLSLFVDGLKED